MELVEVDLCGREVRIGKFLYSSKCRVLPHVAELIKAKLLEPPKKRTPQIDPDKPHPKSKYRLNFSNAAKVQK